jgi:prepilin-type N-terminal cleavage/methylation domain-containing protein
MVSLKQRQSGFTIVELLIVIVIIGILATLVIVTFSGVQQKARDSERKTDINAIAGQLEAAYANKGYYPGIAGFNDATTRSDLEIRIDLKALADPKAPATQSLTAGATPTPTNKPANPTYNYYYTTSGCTGTGVAEQCTGYVVYAYLEGTDPTSVYSRQSNN